MKTAKKLGLAVAVATTMGMSSAMAAEVNIGFSGPLSGGAALYGENVLSGLRMAADEINEAGGFDLNGEKTTINIIALDDQYSPAQAATNAKRLKQESNVPAIFIPHSGGIFALMDFNVEDDFIVMAYTSVPTITEQGNPLTIRIPPTFDGYVKAFTDYALENWGTKLAMGGATHEYAKIWASMVEKAWTAKGGEIVAQNPMDYNKSADFFTGVSRLISENPDVMFVGGASEPTGLVMQQARQLGYEGAFIMMDQAKIDEAANVVGGYELLEDTVGVVPLTVYETEAAQSFIERYEEIYGKTPGSEAAFNYGALHGLVAAMDKTESTDPETIRAALGDAIANLEDSKNPYVVEGVDEKGGFITAPTMAVVKDGKIVEEEF
ncbi:MULTISPECIES: ABC transporter substrate-binding protein [Marinobacter]|jgi:branched-chain amino acid transport system substrate-binding protein|uniref:Branched-chain amino acid transport system substrate-binding protein n=1 Tax=Marinobacter segnicrescens TaxID=430453 RepID=A0A1I0ERY9_9GAMM|nr:MULTISPECIES: ABC transporter substrate-binding protein [Marinobacter]UZD65546.1 ABC transporter substrate-binding protein [Marinobacter sp. AN1]SET47328.1 branched-chain amino acid transport system substrate-binding protein [Marinobacter segnicrescens]